MHMFNISWRCDNLICMFSVLIFHVPLQGSEKRNCGWWYQGCEIQSLQFYPIHFLPQNSGKCNCRLGVSYLCKFATSRAPAASQITFSSSVVFLFPPQDTRQCRCEVLVVCSIHAHVQHLMHLRISDLRVFSFYFPCPTSRSGKWNCGWWYRLSNSISSVLPFSVPTPELRKM